MLLTLSTLQSLVSLASTMPGIDSVGIHGLGGCRDILITLTGPGCGRLVLGLGGASGPWRDLGTGLGDQRHVHIRLPGLEVHAIELRRNLAPEVA